MQFFAQIVVDVAANPVERSAEAVGTVVIPFSDGGSNGESGNNTDGSGGAAGSGASGNGSGGTAGDGEAENADEAVAGNGETVSAEGGISGNDEPGSAGAEGTGSGTKVSVDVRLPVKWQEDGMAVCHVVFEFNDEEIVEHCPVETWHSGEHILSLYYPIEKIVANYTNTFNVYLWMERVQLRSGAVLLPSAVRLWRLRMHGTASWRLRIIQQGLVLPVVWM